MNNRHPAQAGKGEKMKHLQRQREIAAQAIANQMMMDTARTGGSSRHGDGTQPAQGYAVAVLTCRPVTNADDLQAVILSGYDREGIQSKREFFGIWIDPITGETMAEISEAIPEAVTALRNARARNQYSVWSFADNREYTLAQLAEIVIREAREREQAEIAGGLMTDARTQAQPLDIWDRLRAELN
jgi:hypothetical protein